MKKQAFIVLILIGLMFFADALNSLLLNIGSDFAHVSVYIRFVAQVYFIYMLLHTRQGLPIFIVLIFFYLIFAIGSFTYLIDIGLREYDFVGNFRIVNKMLFVFICWETLQFTFDTSIKRRRLFKVYEVLTLTQTGIILLAFVFRLGIFSAYVRVNEDGAVKVARFGYQGLIPSQNEVAAYFLIAFFYFLIKAKMAPKFSNFMILLAITLAALFTGTKVALILPIVFVFFLSREFLLVRRKQVYFPGIFLIILLLGIGFWNRSYILNRLEPTINYYAHRFEQYRLDSIVDALLLGRRQKAESLIQDHISHFNIINYLVGGVDLRQAATETDLLDVVARLGIVGGFYYYLLYLRILFFSKHELSLYRLLFIIVWLGVSTVAGHVIFSAINSIYLVILMFAFYSFELHQFQLISVGNSDFKLETAPI